MKHHHLTPSQRGFSIVELLIGLAVGLFVIGGALKLFVDNLSSTRKLVLELRVNQDLRAASDVIGRDLRRAGYWGDSTGAVTTTNANPIASASPYGAVTSTGTSGASQIAYSYSQGSEDNILDSAETFGFRLNAGAIEFQNGSGNWEAITDTHTLTVTTFTVTPAITQVALGQYCASGTCTGTGCPVLNLRSYTINLRGQSATDAAVVRSLRETVRVRNNQLTGACP